jgi:lipopolysaccharide cholinephosphotransferase
VSESAAFSFSEHHKENVKNGMDKAQAKSNLFAIADILDTLGIRSFLFFGTLLGAMREKDFIAHDTDTDLGVFQEFSDRFPEIRAAAEAAGFTILRGASGDRLFSFMRGNEYLDCYVSKRFIAFPFRQAFDVDGSSVPALCLEHLEEADFLGRPFRIPAEAERVLRILYGRNWRVPVLRFPGKPSLANRIRRFLRQRDKLAALGRHFRIRRDSRARGKG